MSMERKAMLESFQNVKTVLTFPYPYGAVTSFTDKNDKRTTYEFHGYVGFFYVTCGALSTKICLSALERTVFRKNQVAKFEECASECKLIDITSWTYVPNRIASPNWETIIRIYRNQLVGDVVSAEIRRIFLQEFALGNETTLISKLHSNMLISPWGKSHINRIVESSNSLEERIYSIIKSGYTNATMKSTKLNNNTDLVEELFYDVLDLMELQMRLEEEFNISITPEMDLTNFKTVGDICNFLNRIVNSENQNSTK